MWSPNLIVIVSDECAIKEELGQCSQLCGRSFIERRHFYVYSAANVIFKDFKKRWTHWLTRFVKIAEFSALLRVSLNPLLLRGLVEVEWRRDTLVFPRRIFQNVRSQPEYCVLVQTCTMQTHATSLSWMPLQCVSCQIKWIKDVSLKEILIKKNSLL